MTRFVGTPRVAAVLYVGLGLLVLGWAGGEVSWWMAIAALYGAGTVRKAVRDVRNYNQWWSAWQAMGAGGAPPQEATLKPPLRKGRASSWTRVLLAAVSFVVIPFFIAVPGASEALREGLTVVWCFMVLYLVCKLTVTIVRGLRRKRGVTGTGLKEKTQSGAGEVVEWVLPRALSSPSRADAIQNLPEYSARLIERPGMETPSAPARRLVREV
jgi:hypothetical protein